ncbi:MAG: hypothetical protein IIV11_00815 [Clostridia bacterium]|nr:hypothetical protein [Clostridia bacterium]
MDFKKLGRALLFPHIAIMILLLPTATVMLVGSMVFVGTESVIAIISYIIAAYTLTVWCFRAPRLVKFFKNFKNENKYARRWREDARLRVKLSLYASLSWNTLYGIFQLCLGFYHHTFWFCSLGAYYICLAVMRFFLAHHTARYSPRERMRSELKRYRACGIVLLFMNLALALIVFFMVYWNRTFDHHMITAIAMAAYTFTALATAIVNVVKYRKYQSPVYSASKAISLAAACVSMLTLESTMLTTFGDGEINARLMLGLTGGAVVALIVTMAVYMIIRANKQLEKMKEKNNERE